VILLLVVQLPFFLPGTPVPMWKNIASAMPCGVKMAVRFSFAALPYLEDLTKLRTEKTSVFPNSESKG